jgi:hypothetical protein
VPSDGLAADVTAVMPDVADGVAVRYADVAAPWLGEVGGDDRGRILDAAIVARVAIRYDERAADLVHDEEFEAVLHPLGDAVDVTQLVAVDYDDRDLRTEPVGDAALPFRLPTARIDTKTFFNQVERDLRDHLTRSLTLEIPSNKALKLYGRPGETTEEFAARCERAADDRADEEIAALRDKYEAKATKLRDRIEAAEDRLGVAEEQARGKKTSELFSTAGSVLGGLLGGRKSKGAMLGDLLGDAGTAARRRGSSSASERRVEAAENKVARLVAEYEELEDELAVDLEAIGDKWDDAATTIETLTVGLERTDVSVTHLALVWLPVD